MKDFISQYIREVDGMFRIDVRDGSGRRIRKTFIRREEAKATVKKALLDREQEGQIKSGVKSRRRRMQDAIDEFQEMKSVLRPATVKRYRSLFAWLRKFVGRHKIEFLDEFTPQHGMQLRREYMAPRKDPKGSTDRILTAAPKTVNVFLQTIRGFFQHQVDNHYLTFNPMSSVPNQKVERKKPEYYTEAQEAAFFSVPMDKAYRWAFQGLLLTGTRIEELANLRWVDIDFENRHVCITAHDDFVLKTHNAERRIPMSDRLFELLGEMKAEPLSPTIVFSSPKGFKMRERSLLSVCKRIAKVAGIERAFLHKFRHTYATRLYNRGASLEQIKALLGHSSIKESEVYSHPKSDHLHDVVKLLDG